MITHKRTIEDLPPFVENDEGKFIMRPNILDYELFSKWMEFYMEEQRELEREEELRIKIQIRRLQTAHENHVGNLNLIDSSSLYKMVIR